MYGYHVWTFRYGGGEQDDDGDVGDDDDVGEDDVIDEDDGGNVIYI